MTILCAAFVLSAAASGAVVGPDGIEIEGRHLRLALTPDDGGVVQEFRLPATDHDLAGAAGMLQEGFGVGSFYAPNRRLNERLEIVDAITDRPVFRYTYDCDGPNIKALHVVRTMEFFEDQSSLRVEWRVENRGDEDQWIAPWVRCDVTPGGTFDARDRIDVPTPEGIVQPRRSAFFPASRNWIAATDPVAKETVYGVFDADEVHSYLAVYDLDESECAFQAVFAPRILKAKQVWSTTYRINAARGLEGVDFASDELASQIDYAPGVLRLYLAPARPIPSLIIRARIRAGEETHTLPDKRFDLYPPTVVRCTYDWRAPEDGAYEFLAQLEQNAAPIRLGKDTASPHGGIDTQFIVGAAGSSVFEPWTDAALQLEHGGRVFRKFPAVWQDNLHVWVESSLAKTFREDSLDRAGGVEPVAGISLARRERESFQLIVRAPGETALTNVSVHVGDLVHESGSGVIPAADIRASRVGYYPVRVPTHFETPTGDWPDPLHPLDAFTVPAGECVPIWFTVYARPAVAAGVYRGIIELAAAECGPVEMFLEVEVWDFELPETPYLKTDFGFWPEGAFEACRRLGYRGTLDELKRLYGTNAFAHRVTLREVAQLPPESPDYAASLRAFDRTLDELKRQGAATFAAPPSLLDVPEQLKRADEFVASRGLRDRAFCPIADQPPRPAWPRVFERMGQWNAAAPNIPMMVTTYGLDPFLPDALDIWAVHLPVMDTTNNRRVLERVQAGGEVWWFVNHEPARPYGNLFIDFEGIEHRILFWQTWALGIRGFQYHGVNSLEPDRDPYTDQVDITPTNGNGFLVYPGRDGPIDSIRWEIIRDGIEDYDYLVLFQRLLRRLEQTGRNEPLLSRARAVANFNELVPNLVSFPRDPDVLLRKRAELGSMIVELQTAAR